MGPAGQYRPIAAGRGADPAPLDLVCLRSRRAARIVGTAMIAVPSRTGLRAPTERLNGTCVAQYPNVLATGRGSSRGHLTVCRAYAMMAARFGRERMRMTCVDSTQCCRRLQIAQPVRSTPPRLCCSTPALPPPPPPRELASASSPGFHCKNFISRGLTNGEESPPQQVAILQNKEVHVGTQRTTPRVRPEPMKFMRRTPHA